MSLFPQPVLKPPGPSTVRFLRGYRLGQGSGLDAAFHSKTNLPVEFLNPLAKMIPSNRFDQEFLDEVGPSLGVSVGLALRRADD